MTAAPHGCQARTQGSDVYCHRCGLTWDLGDPERPACKPLAHPRRAVADAVTRTERPTVAPVSLVLPSDPPLDLLHAMERAYVRGGMRDAYRVLMDTAGV